jgi:hypothetical protein
MVDKVISITLHSASVSSLHHEDIPCWGETSRERAFSADVYCYVSARARDSVARVSDFQPMEPFRVLFACSKKEEKALKTSALTTEWP